MTSSPPYRETYDGVPFDERKRPMAAAALLSATPQIEPATGETWTQRDMAELEQRGWVRRGALREDRVRYYVATEIGMHVAESLRDEGFWTDGWDLYQGEELIV